MIHHLTRRGFLGATAGATFAALTGREPLFAAAPEKIAPTADAVVILWMAGGMAQTETFDPKKYTPYESGLKSEKVLSTFKSIDTAVDNIKFSEGLERIGKVMDRGALIRTFQAGDLGFILHSRHQYHWHTGYAPPQTVAMPHMGAVISRALGPRNATVPAFIDIRQNLEIGGESSAVKAFHTAGFLGSEHGPFLITDPNDAVASVQPLADLGEQRFRSRRQLYADLLKANPMHQYAGDIQRDTVVRSVHPAGRLLPST